MVYARIHDHDHPFCCNKLMVTTRKDLAPHPSLLIIDVRTGPQTWRIINFYNDADDPSALHTFLSLDLDPLLPTLLMGDFNLHSHTWSMAGWTPSPAASHLKEWAATNILQLLTEPGIPMHRGEGGVQDSVLDLTWCNLMATEMNTFQGTVINWAGAINSDHTLIHTCAWTQTPPPFLCTDCTNSFNTDLDPEEWEHWHEVFMSHAPPPLPLLCPWDIDLQIEWIYAAFNTACSMVMKRKGMAPAHNSHWWNEDCSMATQTLATAEDQASRNVAAKALKRTVCLAKCTWADNYITMANIWEVAAWHHGHWMNKVPALRDTHGDLHFNHDSMTDLLAN